MELVMGMVKGFFHGWNGAQGPTETGAQRPATGWPELVALSLCGYIVIILSTYIINYIQQHHLRREHRQLLEDVARLHLEAEELRERNGQLVDDNRRMLHLMGSLIYGGATAPSTPQTTALQTPPNS